MLTVTVILIVTVFIVLSGKSYAYLEKSVEGSCVSLEVGTLTYTNSGKISLEKNEEIEFRVVVQNNDNIASKYQVYYTSNDNLADVEIGYAASTKELSYGEIEAKGKKEITLVLRNRGDSAVILIIGVKGGLSNNTVEDIILEDGEVRINKEISTYVEGILNGTEPVLTDNLVPVTIEDNGTVKRADTTLKWYGYEELKWANAVVLRDNTIEYSALEVIPEENIESYFVWIPKYSYRLFDLGNYSSVMTLINGVRTIDVVFGTSDTSDSISGECATPGVAGENGNCEIGDYMTHPAFQAFDTNGFWVGKFESGYNGATSTEEAQVNTSDTSKLIIKPNVYSWRNITVGNAFKTVYDYMREEDSHMMKNTEWGAVAYLQHSIYGSRQSVRVNNNSAYITGYAATVEPTLSMSGNLVESTALNKDGTNTKMYNTTTGYTASTTNNISGVYDMSGGALEYVMGYNESASSVGGSSGLAAIYGDFFTSTDWEKYYDKYKSTSETLYSNRILGDATGEMGPYGNVTDPDGVTRHRTSWYGDYAYFVTAAYPWFHRGGRWSYGVVAGAFSFSNDTGGVGTHFSFRIVLTP